MHVLNATNKVISIFSQIDDPRSDINKLHNLIDILLIGIISVICGAETWKQMVQFAKSKEDFLKTFLELPNEIPSKDTINRTFSVIESQQFESCFISWVASIADLSKGEVIAIDGKTIKGAKSKGNKSPIHMVSVFSCAHNLVLEEVKTNEKSNEITAIPELLDMLEIAGNTITIDAMGTQKEIAEKIVEMDANYILAVKENQRQLLEYIKDEFRFSKSKETCLNQDLDHGRIETRRCSVINDFQFIESNNKWKKLTSIIKIESTREFKNSQKSSENSIRYYISSLNEKANAFQSKIRSHWVLDVAFSEDYSRK